MGFGIFHESVKSWWTEVLYNLHYSESTIMPKIISQTKAVFRRYGFILDEANDGKKSNVFCWPY